MNDKIYVTKLYDPDTFEYSQIDGYFTSEEKALYAVKEFFDKLGATYSEEDYDISIIHLDRNYLLL